MTLALSLLFATAGSVLADGHEGTLPASGGTVEFSNGVSIKTPDGASNVDVNLTLTELEGDDIPGEPPEGKAFGSLAFSIDSDGPRFSQFAQVTIPYTAGDRDAARGARDDSVTIYEWEPVSGTWIELYPIPDIINRTLTISVQTLGTYTVMITLPEPAEPTPTPTATIPAVEPTEAPPDTGGVGVNDGMVMGLALLGLFFVIGGGYVLVRTRR